MFTNHSQPLQSEKIGHTLSTQISLIDRIETAMSIMQYQYEAAYLSAIAELAPSPCKRLKIETQVPFVQNRMTLMLRVLLTSSESRFQHCVKSGERS